MARVSSCATLGSLGRIYPTGFAGAGIWKSLLVAASWPCMDYQLVLQFRGDSLDHFDAMVALEDELTEELGDSADVDGHDIGSGETNIFIFTSDPAATFQRVRPVLERTHRLQAVTAAYREADGERYTVIWPEGSQREFIVA